MLRPDSGIENADDHVFSVIGVAPETRVIGEAEEGRGVSGVDLTRLIWYNGDDGGVATESGGLGR